MSERTPMIPACAPCGIIGVAWKASIAGFLAPA
jgi:hypothetical protein